MSRPPQDPLARFARVQRDDSNDSYADMDSVCNALNAGGVSPHHLSHDSYDDMDSVCNALSTGGLSPHRSSPPEPEISGEAIAFALSARSQSFVAHARAPTSQPRGGVTGWPLELGAEEQRHGALGWRDGGVQLPASSEHLFQRTQSDPAAKRAREFVHPVALQSWDSISLPSEAGSNADLGGKRLKSGNPTHAATPSAWTGGRVFDGSQEFSRSPFASAASVQRKSTPLGATPALLYCAALLSCCDSQDWTAAQEASARSSAQCVGGTDRIRSEGASSSTAQERPVGVTSGCSQLLLPLSIDIPESAAMTGIPPSWRQSPPPSSVDESPSGEQGAR